MAMKLNGLYLVTPDLDDSELLVRRSDLALAGGARLLQYRHKTATPALRLEQAGLLLALCRRHGVPFIVNDHVELCRLLDADGVHVGATDLSVAAARLALGPDKIVGASCYGSLDLARQARDQGADYIALGGFYPSRVKQYPVTTAPQLAAQAKDATGLPVVVIGGMTVANAPVLVAQGADMVAAISSVYGAADPHAAAAALAALFEDVPAPG